MTTELKALAAMTAINKMLTSDGHFSICTLDTVITALDVVPDPEKYKVLRLLHCVNYRDMPREILQQLPGLIAEVTFLADKMPRFGAVVDDRAMIAQGDKVARLRIGRVL